MPFYTRIRARRPLWQPVLLGAGLLLVLTTARAVLVVPALAESRPGILARVLYIVGFTVIGGSVAGACYWVLGCAPFKRPSLLRMLGGTVSAIACLIVFALASSQFGHGSPVARLLKPAFVISTLLVSVLFGGLYGRGLLPRSGTVERIYLTPAEFTALPPVAQAGLQPEGVGTPNPADTTGAL
jgi:hypothetical protein